MKTLLSPGQIGTSNSAASMDPRLIRLKTTAATAYVARAMRAGGLRLPQSAATICHSRKAFPR
ncbi:protein of unknown function [Bradyrhizobium vignae]|uniref:Uncharacterized protein n=1 Tax=Bradyrhizobium vignae TaxID=1549949 RepID=A0A2U3PT91_9BRAD|nr:protein of unknown function [Bradyrhizobium vignae]